MVEERTSDELLSRYQRIQELAERRAEQRRKRLRLYWLLLALALVLAVATLFVGRPAKPPSKEELAREVTPEVAVMLPSDPTFRQGLESQVSGWMPTPAAYAPGVVAAVSEDPELAARFRELTGHGEAELAAVSRQLQLRVQRALQGTLPAGSPVAELESRLGRVEGAFEELKAQQSASSLDRRLDEAAARMARVESQTEATNRRLEELAAEIGELRQLVLPSLSYVVKAGAETRIPELGITVEVGRLEDSALSGVRIHETASGRQLYPDAGAAAAAVGLGEPFAFDHGGQRLRLTFGYSVNRWVARDLIGLEIRRLPR